jgi:acid stress-induced BolA-like protein IbaG/YrbA
MASTQDAIREALAAAINASAIEVRGGDGGHFNIEVTSAEFDGKSTLERHRMVLNAIKELMAGHDAPVHAVDTIKARVS